MTKDEFILNIAKEIYVAKGLPGDAEVIGDQFKKLIKKVQEAYESVQSEPGKPDEFCK
jgi:hypothetical protein